MTLGLTQIIVDTLTSDGGALAVTHRPNLVDGQKPWRLQLSFGGEDFPQPRRTATRAAHGFGDTLDEAVADLADDLQGVLDATPVGR
jgi:hypothetical protein